jgi:N-succinyldiaminopimelate aminotransferase
MMANPRLAQLSEFAFRRLARLLDAVPPPGGLEPIDLSIGEPRHPVPPLLAETVAANAHLWGRYPPVLGTPGFREAACAWLTRRFALPPGLLDPDRHVLPLAGTKEGLFMLALALVPERRGGAHPAVLMPNPVYGVYVGAAVIAGAEPVLLPATRENGFLPDLDALEPSLLRRTVAFYLCSPSNPQGAIADRAYLARALDLAREHGFVLVADECYSELWYDAPPPGGLEVAAATGSLDNLVVFHSLSKRSSAPGLRAGFVAGDPELLRAFLRLRAYASPVQPLPLMAAAEALWRDEAHVEANRALYQDKLARIAPRLEGRLGFRRPAGGFFLWLEVGDGEAMAARLWREAGVKALPGAYLAESDASGHNPGHAYLRLALVPDLSTLEAALDRLDGVLARAP